MQVEVRDATLAPTLEQLNSIAIPAKLFYLNLGHLGDAAAMVGFLNAQLECVLVDATNINVEREGHLSPVKGHARAATQAKSSR